MPLLVTPTQVVDRLSGSAVCQDGANQNCIRVRPTTRALGDFLGRAPLAHALFRAAEVEALQGVPLPRPVLDLGCGRGEFATLSLDGSFDAGVDICPRQLDLAARTGRYASLYQADARHLPFPDEVFGCVFSLSVLEHIPSPTDVVAEAFRVLRPGGIFVGTVVLSDLHEHLYYPGLFRRVGLGLLGRAYRFGQDRAFHHRTMLAKGDWDGLLTGAGFRLAVSRRVVPPAVVRWWDRLLPVAVPYRLLSGLGLPLLWRPAWFRSWVLRRAQTLLSAGDERGGVLLFIARKGDPFRDESHPVSEVHE
jgi:SAM-dependent methyltransferase